MKYDYENVMSYAVEQAAEKGEAKGKAERDQEIAKNMLAEGMDKALICRLTGLSPEKLQRL